MVARFCCQGRHYRKLERNRPWRNHEGKHGTLFLNLANDFTGTVAGMAGHDGIDLANFAFSSHPSITGVAGTGAAGSTTDVTIADGPLTTTIHLLNQYANQFAVSASAYNLTPDRQPNSAYFWNPFHLGQPSLSSLVAPLQAPT